MDGLEPGDEVKEGKDEVCKETKEDILTDDKELEKERTHCKETDGPQN